MSEIVERLLQSIQVGETKEGGAVWRDPTDIEIEAAAEIERLEAEVSRLTNLAQEGRKAVRDAAQKINIAAVRALELGGEGRLRTTAEVAQYQSEQIVALTREPGERKLSDFKFSDFEEQKSPTAGK